jgi:cytosine/adenosine deaminase-related metal-dependent hydrolase
MQFRKLKGNGIFDGYRFLRNKVLLVNEDGTIKGIVEETEAGTGIENFEGIISPGFINCHCHLELSHLKGLIPEKTGLVDFVVKVVNERHFREEQVLEAIRNAEDELIKNGIVAVGDICNNLLTLPQKLKRHLHYYNFIEASGWLPSVAKARFERAKTIFEIFSILKSSFSISNSIVPHAPYSVSENLWKNIQPYFENKTVSIHNQETPFEDQFFIEGKGDFNRMYLLMNIDNKHHSPTGRSSLQSYFKKLKKASSIILVHNTFTTQTDIDYVNGEWSMVNSEPGLQTINSKPETFFCLCVNANQYIEDALPPIELFRSNNLQIVLGTDSLASNHSLNILDEIKTIRKFFPLIPLEEMLQWATLNGAKALQMDDQLGSFEAGKKPGVVLINENDLTVQKLI